MTPRWSHNLFKGRVGEAVIEAVLSEFGYLVTRGGYEIHLSGNPSDAPDLIVEYPPTGARELVEVKYRSARPTAVDLSKKRILEYRSHHPGTILAISAAWNGAIYCARVEDLPIDISETQDLITLNLLDDYWRHISLFFPIVQKGERLGRLWTELKDSLGSFGRHEIRGRGIEQLWDTEIEDLSDYLSNNWTEDLLQLGIQKPQPEQMNLEELWEQVRHVSAVTLAEDLTGDSEDHPIETNTMMQAVQRVLGNRGENQLTFDIGSLTDSLQAHWDTLGLDDEQKSAAHNIVAYFFMGIVASAMKPAKPQHRELARKIVELLPDGYGEAFFADPAFPIENAERFDLKTAIKLISSPCRING